MEPVTISRITEQLRKLPADKLIVVYDFVSYLSEREADELLHDMTAKPNEAMLASEAVLRRDWDRPEEDSAWANL